MSQAASSEPDDQPDDPHDDQPDVQPDDGPAEQPEGSDGPTPDDLLRLDQQVCFALAVAARTVIGLYRPVLEPLGLTHPQYLVMLALWERAPLTLKEIGELLSLDAATVSPLVKRLEGTGLVARARHPHDDRALQVTLTPRGADLRSQALFVPPQIIKRLGMEVGELHELHASLTRVIAASRAAADPA
jgi:DNA-binding MarR family transcriptional regulator